MVRTASGAQHIEAARKLLKAARTADDLRLAQSVLLPLELGLSIEQTAVAIGRSSGATCTMRTRFAKVAAGEMDAPRSKRQLRNRAKANLERERQILDEVLPNAVTTGVIVIPRVKSAIEAKLGKTLALCSVYRMLARHGWRKLAPDTHHPQGDPQARQEWKKTPLRTGRNRKEFCHRQSDASDVSGPSQVGSHQRHALLLGVSSRATHGQGDAHPPVHLRLWRSFSHGWKIRLPGTAPAQHRMHATVHHRNCQPLPATKHCHGARRCGLAQEHDICCALEFTTAFFAAVLAATQSPRAHLG